MMISQMSDSRNLFHGYKLSSSGNKYVTKPVKCLCCHFTHYPDLLESSVVLLIHARMSLTVYVIRCSSVSHFIMTNIALSVGLSLLICIQRTSP